MRYTPKQLAIDVEQINENCENAGLSIRFVVGGRNGSQAVDEIELNEAGENIHGTAVKCNVECGTSRECYEATHSRYQGAYLNHLKRDDE